MDHYSAHALSGAWVFATLAVLFGWLYLRHRDAGARWFFVAYVATALLYLFDHRLRPHGDIADPASSLVAAAAFTAFTAGLFDNLGLDRRRRLRFGLLALVPLLASALVQWAVPMPRWLAFGALAATMGVLAWPVWQSSRAEPGVGTASRPRRCCRSRCSSSSRCCARSTSPCCATSSSGRSRPPASR